MTNYSDHVLVPREVFDAAGKWMSAALDCEQTCAECKRDFSTLLEAAEPLTYQQVKDMVIDELIEKARDIGATIHSPQFVTTDRATGEELLYSADLATWLKSQIKEE